MEAFKNLIKNSAWAVLLIAIPSLCWASEAITPFSLTSLFLLLAGILFIFWHKGAQEIKTLRKLLSMKEEAWALFDGDQLVEKAHNFPGNNLNEFRNSFSSTFSPKLHTSIAELIYSAHPFKLKIHAEDEKKIYLLAGEPFDNKSLLSLKDITEVVRQEKALHMNCLEKQALMDKLQIALQTLPFPVWLRDENQKLIFCNLAYQSAVQAAENLVYEQDIELIPSKLSKPLARRALNSRETTTLEEPTIIDGERRHYRVYETPTFHDNETLGFALDISELYLARKELKQLVDAHNEVLDHLSTAINVFSVDGTLQYYNQAYVKLHHFDEDFLKNYPHLDEILENLRSRRQLPEHADFPAYKKQRLRQLSDQVEPLEELMHLPDERTLRIFSAPHPSGGLLFMLEDVTNYLALESTNKSLLESYQTTLNNLFEGVVVIGSDLSLKFFNPCFVKMWGFQDPDVIKPGKHFSAVVEHLKDVIEYDDEWETYKSQFMQRLSNRVQASGQLRLKAGHSIHFTYVPLPNGDHLLSYTETDTAHQPFEKTNTAVEISDEIEQTLLTHLSKEVKPPLQTIIGFAETLLSQTCGTLNERQIGYAKGVLDSSHKLLSLVSDILELDSPEEGEIIITPSKIDIPSLILEIISLTTKTSENAQTSILFRCPPSLQEWIIDGRRFKEALLSTLKVMASMPISSSKIIVEATPSSEELKISIFVESSDQANTSSDHCDVKSHSFDLAKKIVALHGGQFSIIASPEASPKITLTFPRYPSIPGKKNNIAYFKKTSV